jgi:hypothetical protein
LLDELTRLRQLQGEPSSRFEVTVGSEAPTDEEIAEFEELGVDRLIVSPWTSTRDAVDSIASFAWRHGLEPADITS